MTLILFSSQKENGAFIGGVHSFVYKLTRFKITPDRDKPTWHYVFDWLKNCSIFACIFFMFIFAF